MATTSDHELSIDANSLLSELDKGLRSNRMGEECEAIVRFPWLFTRYPFPILINSACLKLAEVFRNGSNFSRLLILKVIQESDKHLDKILNVDEFVRRIFSVTYSNDPIARAITLRTLGSISVIVAERKNIHHSIRNALESQDEVEVIAAIEASAAFAKRSVDFAINIYPKVMTMLSQQSTPTDTKINLLQVLHHSHYNTSTAIEVRQRLIQYLSTSFSEKFVCAILNTLTYISFSSLIQIPQQIQLLLSHFNEDRRKKVKISALRELRLLAKNTHVWTKDNVKSLLECVDRCPKDDSLLSGIMSILMELVKCPCLLAGEIDYLNEFETKIVSFCINVICNDYRNILLLSVCLCILTELSLHSTKILKETVKTVEKFINSSMQITESMLAKNTSEYKVICKCIVTLCNRDENEVVEPLKKCLKKVLLSEISSQWMGFVCETLCAIQNDSGDVQFVNELNAKVKKCCEDECSEDSLTKLFTLYFQTCNRLEIECSQDFLNYLNGKSHWFCYRLIRQAMRYGHHHVAHLLCEKLLSTASSENIHFWILSVSKACKAESYLKIGLSDKELEQRIIDATSLYVESLSALKAGVTPSNPLIFTYEYSKLRFKLLHTHILLRQACKLVRTSPAPAIASSAALSSRDDLMKCGVIVTQMRKCAKEFRSLADGYSDFYQTSFNADNDTLAHLQLLQHSCTIFAEAIESVFQSNRLSGLFVNKDTHLESNRLDLSLLTPPEHKKLINVCHRISRIVREELSTLSGDSVIGANQITTLLSMSRELLSIPLCTPRLFFQSVQATCIKLAISPQPKSQEFIITSCNTNFALKVEGVVVNGGQGCKVIRKVAKVILTVTTCLVTKSGNSDQLTKPINDGNVQLMSLVVPHNDYFQEQFLLPLLPTGVYMINVEASIIDENEAQWKTGPNVSISIKVVEDSTLK